MKAIGNNIVILPKKVTAEKTKGGLLLMEKDKENIRYKEAVVVAVSDEIKFLQPGMEIYYDKHAGHGIEFEDENYTVIKLQDVVIVL
jgi:co-chaperonin GroES (HSP10)